MMNGQGKSDGRVVPVKSPNKAGQPTAAEEMEGSLLTKGNSSQQNTRRIQGRERMQSALGRVRQRALNDKKLKFTSLMHHITAVDTLREAYYSLKRDAAAGIDGETWRHYEESLEENLQDLSGRLKRGAYRAKPVRRTYIPKADGKQRPLGVPVLEDKIVQYAAVLVLNAIYETEFRNFSYGYRPGRSQHNCLDALYVGIVTKKVNWIIDADIRGFFDTLDHGWLVKFIEHRIGDPRVVRLIQKWLRAGVMERGQWQAVEEGTPQGGVISPLLSNVFLHYVLDLWIHHWRRTQAQGDVIVVRWADDFVIGFQSKGEAERCLAELQKRFEKFGLALHPDKTRLLEFGAFAIDNRRRRNQRRPETFDFLGFTHICAKKRSNGMFTVVRKTVRKRLSRKLQEVKVELRKRMHVPIPEQGKWLRSVVGGFFRYHGVPTNGAALYRFWFQVGHYWHHTLRRRGSRKRLTWNRMYRLIARWLPPVAICHPYPLTRMGVIT
jgi:group II intron reverse transcriptase/maturase